MEKKRETSILKSTTIEDDNKEQIENHPVALNMEKFRISSNPLIQKDYKNELPDTGIKDGVPNDSPLISTAIKSAPSAMTHHTASKSLPHRRYSVPTMFGYTDPKVVPPGRITLSRLLEILTIFSEYRKIVPQEYEQNVLPDPLNKNSSFSSSIPQTSEEGLTFLETLMKYDVYTAIADKYALPIEQVKMICEYYRLFEIFFPKIYHEANRKAITRQLLDVAAAKILLVHGQDPDVFDTETNRKRIEYVRKLYGGGDSDTDNETLPTDTIQRILSRFSTNRENISEPITPKTLTQETTTKKDSSQLPFSKQNISRFDP